MIRVLLAATAEHEEEITKTNAARLAAEHDRDEARAAEECARQERDEARKRVREWEDLHEKEMSGRLQEGRYVALQARAEHAEAELLNQMRERKAAEQWHDQERQRAERAEQNCAEMKEATRNALEIVEPMRDAKVQQKYSNFLHLLETRRKSGARAAVARAPRPSARVALALPSVSQDNGCETGVAASIRASSSRIPRRISRRRKARAWTRCDGAAVASSINVRRFVTTGRSSPA